MKTRVGESGSPGLVADLFASVATLRKEAARLAKDTDRFHKKDRPLHGVADRLHKRIASVGFVGQQLEASLLVHDFALERIHETHVMVHVCADERGRLVVTAEKFVESVSAFTNCTLTRTWSANFLYATFDNARHAKLLRDFTQIARLL